MFASLPSGSIRQHIYLELQNEILIKELDELVNGIVHVIYKSKEWYYSKNVHQFPSPLYSFNCNPLENSNRNPRSQGIG